MNPLAQGPMGNAGLAGGGLSQYPDSLYGLASSSVNSGTTGGTGGSTQVTASYYLAPLPLNNHLNYTRVNLMVSNSSAAGTGSLTAGNMVGIYTLAGGTALSLSTSYVFNLHVSQNSATAQSFLYYWGTNSTSNSTASNGNAIGSNYTGARMVPAFLGTDSLSAGQYFVVNALTQRSGGANLWAMNSHFAVSESQTTMASELGTTDIKAPVPLVGIFSSTTNVSNTGMMMMPVSINTTAITNTGGTSQWRIPFVQFAGK